MCAIRFYVRVKDLLVSSMIYIQDCCSKMCVCVCVRERERERESQRSLRLHRRIKITWWERLKGRRVQTNMQAMNQVERVET